MSVKSRMSFSLPKQALPTSTRKTKTTNRKVVYEDVSTCPEVSEFNINETFYLHKLPIDYGKISNPKEWDIQQEVEAGAALARILRTKKMQNYHHKVPKLNKVQAYDNSKFNNLHIIKQTIKNGQPSFQYRPPTAKEWKQSMPLQSKPEPSEPKNPGQFKCKQQWNHVSLECKQALSPLQCKQTITVSPHKQVYLRAEIPL